MKYGVTFSLQLDMEDVIGSDTQEAEKKGREIADAVCGIVNDGLPASSDKVKLSVVECVCVDGFVTGES